MAVAMVKNAEQGNDAGGSSGDGERAMKGGTMRRCLQRVSVMACVALIGAGVLQAQAPPKEINSTNVTQVKGLTGVKDKTGGRLMVYGETLHFTHEMMKVDVPTPSIEDVITGADSQRLIHGTLGTLTMFAPYESGRFLSLFRTKLDTLTIKYRDTDGGLHGAIFTMGVGKADAVKKDLLAHGAHSSAPDVEETSKATAAKEQKQ
jgi:hypothetical protein